MSVPQYEGHPIHPTEAEPRLAPLATDGMRPEWLLTLSHIPGAGLKGAGFPHHVLGELMYNPETFGPFIEYWITCKSKMSLSVREQELVILRMACLYRSNYVWKHHLPVGREFGIDDREFLAIARRDYSAFAARVQALLTFTDEFVEKRTLEAATWAQHRSALAAQDVVDLISLVSQYVLFALANNVLQVQVESPLASVPGIEAF